jgi:transposase-like protein
MVKRIVLKNGQGINPATKAVIKDVDRNWQRESRLAMIQMLIPLGLEAVGEELQAEIRELAGEWYSRGGDVKRWGSNPGSVFVGDQKLGITVPRVRNLSTNEEVQLRAYHRLQSPQVIDDIVLSRVIGGISHGDYEKAAVQIPETFGIKKTAVCRKFIRASAKKLQWFLERDLSAHDIVALFVDGKTFGENEMVIALGITIDGDKVLLGFIETSTENYGVCRDFLNGLRDRGLCLDHEILFIIDGGKGLYKGIKKVMGAKAVIQRCQWHKRENVVEYLSPKKRDHFRRKLQNAYEQPTYDKAKKKLGIIRKELQFINASAVKSLDEGLEETLTLHRLGMFDKLGESFKTTNCIENVNKQVCKYTDRVSRWQNSDQRQRWVGMALIEIEPRLNKVRGYKFLKQLRMAMTDTAINKNQQLVFAA